MKVKLIKKAFIALLIGVIGLNLFGCGTTLEDKEENNIEKKSSNALSKIKEKGKLVIGLKADYPPYEFHKIIDGKDQIVGFDVSIAKEIAKDLGVELEIKDMEFDSLIGALPAEKIDMVVSGMNPTPKRSETVDFSDLYYEATHGLLIRKEDNDIYKSLEDFKGKKIGAQMGSTQAEIVKTQLKGSEVKLLGDVNALILELKAGKIEGLVTELPVAEMAVKSNQELVISEAIIKDEEGGSAVAIKKGEKELLDQVNKTIKILKNQDKINEFVIEAQKLAYE